jgi:addiction module HigA family antidote
MLKNGMRPVHPGEVLLQDYIQPMGVSVRAVALAMHVPYSRLSKITKGKRGVTADTALRLERYFGSEARGWLNLQSAYDLRTAEIAAGKTIAKEIRPLTSIPVIEFVEPHHSIQRQLLRGRSFFTATGNDDARM